MRSTPTMPVARTIVLDEALITRLAWVAAAAALFATLFVAGWYVLFAAGAGVAAAVAVTWHLDNEVRRDFRTPLNGAWIAALDALADNGISVRSPVWHGATEGRVAAGRAVVVVEKHPGNVSRVRVRVGLFPLPDNRRRASLILERVVEYLEDQEITADDVSAS
jgi:hypothetical protein